MSCDRCKDITAEITIKHDGRLANVFGSSANVKLLEAALREYAESVIKLTQSLADMLEYCASLEEAIAVAAQDSRTDAGTSDKEACNEHEGGAARLPGEGRVYHLRSGEDRREAPEALQGEGLPGDLSVQGLSSLSHRSERPDQEGGGV